MYETVLYSEEGHVGIATLNRPAAFNALDLPMITSLQAQLLRWQSDDTIKAVVVRSEHPKAFCAGGDVRWLYDHGLANNTQSQLSFFSEEYRLNHFIHHFKKPYIALMNGITMGGGVGIALHGAYTVATNQFQFAMPETSIGFFPDIGASYLLSRCPGALGIYLGLTGNRLNAQEAHYADLVRYVIDTADYDEVLSQLTAHDFNEQANTQIEACLASFHRPETPTLADKMPLINHCFSAPTVEEIKQRLHDSEEEAAQDWLATLNTKSPLSLKITLAQLLRTKGLSLDACLQIDYVLVQHFMTDHDFYEGVRALLVDKDKNPQWNPAVLAQIEPQQVEEYFERRQPALDLLL